jgi:hypothetical protein
MSQPTVSSCGVSQADSQIVNNNHFIVPAPIGTSEIIFCRAVRIPACLEYVATCVYMTPLTYIDELGSVAEENLFIFGCYSPEERQQIIQRFREFEVTHPVTLSPFSYLFVAPILHQVSRHGGQPHQVYHDDDLAHGTIHVSCIIPPRALMIYPKALAQPVFRMGICQMPYQMDDNPFDPSQIFDYTRPPVVTEERDRYMSRKERKAIRNKLAIQESLEEFSLKSFNTEAEFLKWKLLNRLPESATLRSVREILEQRLALAGDIELNPGPTPAQRKAMANKVALERMLLELPGLAHKSDEHFREWLIINRLPESATRQSVSVIIQQRLAQAGDVETNPGPNSLSDRMYNHLLCDASEIGCSCRRCMEPNLWKWELWRALVGRSDEEQKCIYNVYRHTWPAPWVDKPSEEHILRAWTWCVLTNSTPPVIHATSCVTTIHPSEPLQNQGIFAMVTGIDTDGLNGAATRANGIFDGVETIIERMVRATDADHVFNDGNICTVISIIMQVFSYIKSPDNLALGAIAMSAASLFAKEFSLVKTAIKMFVEAVTPRTQDNIEGLPNHIGIEKIGLLPMVGALGMLLLHTVPSATTTKKVVESIRLSGAAVKLMESGGNLMSKILDFLPVCISAWVYEMFPAMRTVEFMMREDVLAFISRSSVYEEAGFIRSGHTTTEQKQQLIQDVQIGHDLYDEALSLYGEKPMPTAFVRAVTTVNKVGGIVKAGFSRDADSQMCPFWLFISGPSNIGKSVITRDIAFIVHGLDVMKQIPKHPGEEEATYYERSMKLARSRCVYDRRPGQKFWDSYQGKNGGHFVVVIDDFGQCDPKITGNPEGAELISLLSATNAQLEMASLEEKGTILDSPLVITSSNVRDPSLPEITVKAAILRRRNCVVEVTIDPSKGTWMPTSAGGEGHWVFNKSYVGGKYDQYQFQVHDSMTDVKEGPLMNFDQFIKVFSQKYIQHHQHQKQTLLVPNQTIHLALGVANEFAEAIPSEFKAPAPQLSEYLTTRDEPFYDARAMHPVGGRLTQSDARDALAAAHATALMNNTTVPLGVPNNVLRYGREMRNNARDLVSNSTIFEKIRVICALSVEQVTAKFGEWATTIHDWVSKIHPQFFMLAGMVTGVGAFLFKQAWDHYHPSQHIEGQFMQGELFTREKILSMASSRIMDIAKPECEALLKAVRTRNPEAHRILYNVIGVLDTDDWQMEDFEFANQSAVNYNSEPRKRRTIPAGRIANRNRQPYNREALINQAFLELDIAMNGETAGYKHARKLAEEDLKEGRVPEFMGRMVKNKNVRRAFGDQPEPMLRQMYCNRHSFLNKMFAIDRYFYDLLVTHMSQEMDWDEIDQVEHLKRISWTEETFPADLIGFRPDAVQVIPYGVENQIGPTNFAEQLADYLQSMYRNLVHLGFGPSPELRGLFGIGVAGDVLVTVNHLFNHLVQGQEFVLECGGKNYTLKYEEKSKWKVPTKDVAFYKLPAGVVPLFKDFTTRFHTNEDLYRFAQRDAMMLSYNTKTQTPMFVAVGHAQRCDEIDYITGHETDAATGEVTYNVNTIAYVAKVRGIPGSCGLPMMDVSPSTVRRILGIHIGCRGQTSVSVAVTKEDCDLAFKMLKGSTKVSYVGTELLYTDISKEPATEVPEAFTVLGKSPVKGFTPEKTVFTQSHLFGKLAEPIKQPAILTSLDPRCPAGWNPMMEGMNKYAHDAFIVDEETVDAVRRHISERILPIFDANHCRKWTLHEALMGIEGDPVAKKLCFSSSAGWPWRQFGGSDRGKYGFIIMRDENGEITHEADLMVTAELKPEVAAMIRAEDAVLQCGGTMMLPFTDQLKDELRLNEKIEAGKTRHFMAGPLDSLLLCRMYFGGFMTAMFRSHNLSYFAPGMDAESPEWDEMTHYLLRPGNMAFAADVSSMDGNENNQYMVMACDVINDWYAAHHTGTAEQLEKDNNARRALMEAVIHAVSVCGDSVHQKHTGMPSGTFLTTFVNSIVLFAYILSIWRKLAPPKLKALRYFDQYCSIKVYGDDFVLTISPEVSQWFNGVSITAAAKRYLGQTFTSANKHSEIVPLIPIEECEFLKRSFVFVPEWNMWIGRYRWDEMISMVDWVRNGNPPVDQLMLNIEEMLEQAVTYGQAAFDGLRYKLVDLLRKEGIPHPVLTYEEAYYDYYTRHHPDENRDMIKASLRMEPGNPA